MQVQGDSAAVQWSTDLVTWHDSGASDGSRTGEIASQTVQDDPETIETVLTFSSGTGPGTAYLRLVVTP